MSDHVFYASALFYGEKNKLLLDIDLAEDLINQIHSTVEFDEKFIKYDNLCQLIKNHNNIKKIQIPKLSPEEKIIYEEERKQYIKKIYLFNVIYFKLLFDLLNNKTIKIFNRIHAV